MRADEVASVLGVSKPYAYKLIKKLNEKLEKTGCPASSIWIPLAWSCGWTMVL